MISFLVVLPTVITHGADARWIATGIGNMEAIIDSIQWMYWIVETSKVERYVQVLAAGYGPVLIVNIVFGALNTSINCIGNVTRNLAMKLIRYLSITETIVIT